MIEKLSWENIINLLLLAKKNLVIFMPAIHKEWVEVIKSNESIAPSRIHVCIDNSEQVIRSGYGDINSIEALKNFGATIKECDGLRISFICSDEEAYCLFLESRMLAGDPEGYNAIKLSPDSARDILYQFTPELFNPIIELESNEVAFKNEQKDSLSSTIFNIKPGSLNELIAKPLKQNKVEEVKAALAKNPPENPDLKRKISTYNTLFQYAELHLEGGNITSKTVSIPSDALPFKDEELKKRLKTSINLFTKEITDKWTEIHDLRKKVDEIRKNYLTPCNIRKEKSILKKTDKNVYKLKVQEIKTEIAETTKQLINKVQSAINNSEDTLRIELEAFFTVNPPDSVKGLDTENTKRQINLEISKILSKINLPNANALVSKIKLEEMYYELTLEDLKDKLFLDWFVNKGLIDKNESDKLADFKNAFAIK